MASFWGPTYTPLPSLRVLGGFLGQGYHLTWPKNSTSKLACQMKATVTQPTWNKRFKPWHEPWNPGENDGVIINGLLYLIWIAYNPFITGSDFIPEVSAYIIRVNWSLLEWGSTSSFSLLSWLRLWIIYTHASPKKEGGHPKTCTLEHVQYVQFDNGPGHSKKFKINCHGIATSRL